MTTVEILKRARGRITAQEDWCKGEFARDKSGKGCSPTGTNAVTWCARGAVDYVTGGGGLSGNYAHTALTDASFELFERGPAVVNDAGTHEQVMHMYDRAIQLSKEPT